MLQRDVTRALGHSSSRGLMAMRAKAGMMIGAMPKQARSRSAIVARAAGAPFYALPRNVQEQVDQCAETAMK